MSENCLKYIPYYIPYKIVITKAKFALAIICNSFFLQKILARNRSESDHQTKYFHFAETSSKTNSKLYTTKLIRDY